MKVFIFGRHSVGDKLLISQVESILSKSNVPFEYCGEKVDFSRIKPDLENTIVVINPFIQYLDFSKILGYIKKDVTKPLIVLRKIKTLGGVLFKPNLEIEKIFVNKVFVFAGVLYVPKTYLKDTFANTLRSIDKKDLRCYFLDLNKRR